MVLNVSLLATLLILNLPLILASFSNLVDFDYSFRVLVGYSMIPTLNNGDTVLIKEGVEDIRVGDIISFEVDSLRMGVTHRVIGI